MVSLRWPVAREGQDVKLKLAPFQFQKYGMVEGTIDQVSADATVGLSPNIAFRALLSLKKQQLETQDERHALAPGMQVAGEIHLGTRPILEYLPSPVQKAFHEAGRER